MDIASYRVSDETRDALEQSSQNIREYTANIVRIHKDPSPTVALPPPDMCFEMRQSFADALRLTEGGNKIIEAIEHMRDHKGAPAIKLENLTTRQSAHGVLEMYRQFMLDGKEDIRQRKHDAINDQFSIDPQDQRVKTVGFKNLHFDPDDYSALTCIEKGNNPRPTLVYDVHDWVNGIVDEVVAIYDKAGDKGFEGMSRSEVKQHIAQCMLEPHWMSPIQGKKKFTEPLIMANPDFDPSIEGSQPYMFCKKEPFNNPIVEVPGLPDAEDSTLVFAISEAWHRLKETRHTPYMNKVQLENGDFLAYSNHAVMHGGGDQIITDNSHFEDMDLQEQLRTRSLAGVDVDVKGYTRGPAEPNYALGKERLHYLGRVEEPAKGAEKA